MWQGDGPTPEVDAIFSHLSSTTRACCTGKANYSCTHMKIAVSVTRDAVCRHQSNFEHQQVAQWLALRESRSDRTGMCV